MYCPHCLSDNLIYLDEDGLVHCLCGYVFYKQEPLPLAHEGCFNKRHYNRLNHEHYKKRLAEKVLRKDGNFNRNFGARIGV
jgi:hypothetical protein